MHIYFREVGISVLGGSAPGTFLVLPQTLLLRGFEHVHEYSIINENKIGWYLKVKSIFIFWHFGSLFSNWKYKFLFSSELIAQNSDYKQSVSKLVPNGNQPSIKRLPFFFRPKLSRGLLIKVWVYLFSFQVLHCLCLCRSSRTSGSNQLNLRVYNEHLNKIRKWLFTDYSSPFYF